MKRGFSTLEIIISFAIIAIVLTGAVMANFGAQYWTITSQTSNEALYKAKTALESVRSIAKTDFYKAVSVPFHSDDPACTGKSSGANGLCYYEETKVTDISTCSKYAESFVSWQIEGYPTSTVSLFTTLSNPNEAVALGGDCLLDQSAQSAESANAWKDPDTLRAEDFPSQPQSIDVFNGVSYIATDQAPQLQIITSSTDSTGNGTFTDAVGYNSVDVARDESTGLTYAYVARNDTSNQLGVIDVSTSTGPSMKETVTLNDPDSSSTNQEGWRINYYGQRLYIATKENDVHIFDVSRPLIPFELGSFTVGSTIYDIKVRNQHSTSTVCRANGGVCTFAYLATSYGSSSGEVKVFDVTSPTSTVLIKDIDLSQNSGCSNAPAALSLALSGNTLYVGRGYNLSCQSIPELYALDITDPYSGVPIISSSVENGDSIVGLRVLGNFLFIETSPLSDANAGSGLMDIDHDYNQDIDNKDHDYAYATINTQGQHLQIWNVADPTRPLEVYDYPLSSDSLQVIYSQN